MEQLDPKVVLLIQELEEAGFLANMSCQGGIGHGTDFIPSIRGKCWISFIGEDIPDSEDIAEVKRIIQKHSKASVRTKLFRGGLTPDDIPDDQLFFITKSL